MGSSFLKAPLPLIPSNSVTSAATEEQRWRAVLASDREADGQFFYAVRTTGVYCRPSCASRQPRREHVSFFESPMGAEAAGFRPCKRCAPNLESARAEQTAALARICRLLEQAEAAPALPELARLAGMSPSHFHRLFKQATGLTPKAYRKSVRAGLVQRELSGAASVTAGIYQAGYPSAARFYEEADALLGMTPTALRRGGAGVVIRFAVASCSLGTVLVAASEKGICALTLGDEEESLVRELRARFPQAQFEGADPDFAAMIARVIAFLEAPGGDFPLPLDVRGTVFQRRVWDALQKIPLGSTVSYQELAERMGHPAAVRAVAGACAANQLAVVIPCHRVLRRNGELSGYRWGPERKRALLQKEGASLGPARPSRRSQDAS